MSRSIAVCASAALVLLAAADAQAQTADIAAGRELAEHYCGGCHAIGAGQSPVAEAPAFADLHRRYPAGGLPQILQEGMLAPVDTQREDSGVRHPKMPTAHLGVEEVFDLIAYLRSIEPKAGEVK